MALRWPFVRDEVRPGWLPALREHSALSLDVGDVDLENRAAAPVPSAQLTCARSPPGIFKSSDDLARKLLRHIREHNKTAQPIKWKYTDVQRRIRGPLSSVTVHSELLQKQSLSRGRW